MVEWFPAFNIQLQKKNCNEENKKKMNEIPWNSLKTEKYNKENIFHVITAN